MVRRTKKTVRRGKKSGFTLVEILIVVIILGILAAIVIPQFTNASQDARNNSLTSQLQTLRSQIELFKLQHGDVLPTLVGGGAAPGNATAQAPSNWSDLMTVTSFGGKNFGPYLQAIPLNPLNSNSNVVNGDGSAAAGSACGFVYDYGTLVAPGTGRIYGTDANGTTIHVE